MENLAYLLALHSVDGLGPIRLKKLLDYFQDPQNVWQAEEKELKSLAIPDSVIQKLKETKKTLDPEKNLIELEKSGIKVLSIFDDSYPKSLKNIYDPPIILYYQGEILEQDSKALGVVGTRKITGYGKIVTEQFTKGLVYAGFTIVSGLARGVDSTAHKTALLENGRTIAVLGGGLNKIFPPENISLSQKITQGFGAVISEFPPDYPHLAGNFPARNRIIAGLSIGVLVTEAAEDSGSMITARLALEYNREVFAVPGPITSYLSKGPANLIKQGASLVTSAAEILEELGVDRVQNEHLKVQSVQNLTGLEKQILEYLQTETKHIDELCRELKIPSSQISAGLIKMEILGLVKNLGGGNYTKSL